MSQLCHSSPCCLPISLPALSISHVVVAVPAVPVLISPCATTLCEPITAEGRSSPMRAATEESHCTDTTPGNPAEDRGHVTCTVI